jgi:hypothetical protein
MKKLIIFVLFFSLLSGCISYLEVVDEPEWVIVKQTETPYERYLRHHFFYEGIPGTCRFCSGVTIDLEVRSCEECYYRVYKIKKQQIKVEPLQFNERVYFPPQYVSYQKKE